MVDLQAWKGLVDELGDQATLIAVSKTKPVADILGLYSAGQRHFGESYVQELADKQAQLPADIKWHFIGHLQSNKVKYIASFVHLIHAVDSFKLLQEINKQAARHDRVIDVLLQMHIADEDTKYGMDEKEILQFLDYYTAQQASLANVRICGLMGMATNTDDEEKVGAEFARLHNFMVHLRDTVFFNKPWFKECSMGMTSDYGIAVANGSTMVRVGSLLFGAR